ncbi:MULTISPECIES: TglA family RiPP precursor [unclassified Streptomyces]|uniref:3-thiaglutamate biosynthesis pearlin carrier peptide TglA n=1 Tax=unclassified Streptomyces TaxID=2593676 RepID=UPI002259BAF2|nr:MULTISPECIES: TglA family RiPP precursor [unclassified Streptomyces]MCX4402701.1 TglA family RiPP precursor [Streptomyces sp. NBC_01764]MCX5182327.1 TglA family RiPP precursor [Streptomyces sp. NBC_00268]
MSLERESLDQEMSADNVAESAPDAATGDAEETFEEFTLDDIEVIESKVFG